MGKPQILLDLMAHVAESQDPPVAPAATNRPEEVTMPTTTIRRADRPLNDVWTSDLVNMIVNDLNPLAVLEAQFRLDHARTLQPQNRRKLQAALATIAAPPEAKPKQPKVKVRSAQTIANERAKKLGVWDVRATSRIARAHQLGWDLTDDDTLVTACRTKVTEMDG